MTTKQDFVGIHEEPDHEYDAPEGDQPDPVRSNRANPGSFTIFMFHPKTVDLGAKSGKGGNELLREYLGMDVDEATLDFYMKQGFYTPTNPNDLRVQLQTALDMLELLSCDDTIAGKGLAYILKQS